jgi:hypothetical protein
MQLKFKRGTVAVIDIFNLLTKQFQKSRHCRVLTMVYNTQKYWAFGLGPSFAFKIVFLVILNPDDGQSPKAQYFCELLLAFLSSGIWCQVGWKTLINFSEKSTHSTLEQHTAPHSGGQSSSYSPPPAPPFYYKRAVGQSSQKIKQTHNLLSSLHACAI